MAWLDISGVPVVENPSGYDMSIAFAPAASSGVEDAVVEEGSLPDKVDVYTAGGVLLRSGIETRQALDGLPAGIYIVGADGNYKRVIVNNGR